jgi:hypothetical protein
MNALPLIGVAPRNGRLRAVHYEQFDWEEAPSADSIVDSVSTSVTLDFNNDVSFRLGWLVEEGFECLTGSARADGRLRPLTRLVDASERWRGLLGARVIDQHISFQRTDWGVQPWACRLDFDSSLALVVALGELAPAGNVTYIPDALVVTSSRDLALNYRPYAATGSAWG